MPAKKTTHRKTATKVTSRPLPKGRARSTAIKEELEERGVTPDILRHAVTHPRRQGRVLVLVGTRKGAFIFESDRRRQKWQRHGPHFPGWSVLHMALDQRQGGQGILFAALHHEVYGANIHRSTDLGATWTMCEGPAFAPDAGETLKRIWRVEPGHAQRPNEVWAGGDPGCLFKSEDGGQTWAGVPGINAHPTRANWFPGAGGLMVHSLLLHPTNPERMYLAISVAGVFRSDDGGVTWTPKNKNTQACFLPEGQQWPDYGQCVHHLVMSPTQPDWLFQQNHCGVYRSRDAGETWASIAPGLPGHFGFAMGILPGQDQTVYVTPEVSDEFRFMPNGALAVYRSRDGGDQWERLARGLPREGAYLNVLREGLATDACQPGGVYVGTSTGQLFQSRTEGNSWSLMADFLPPVYSVATAVLD